MAKPGTLAYESQIRERGWLNRLFQRIDEKREMLPPPTMTVKSPYDNTPISTPFYKLDDIVYVNWYISHDTYISMKGWIYAFNNKPDLMNYKIFAVVKCETGQTVEVPVREDQIWKPEPKPEKIKPSKKEPDLGVTWEKTYKGEKVDYFEVELQPPLKRFVVRAQRRVKQ